MNEIVTEIESDFVMNCNNAEWDRCCECIEWDRCELKYDRFPGIIPVVKKYFKKLFNRDERPDK